MAMFQVYMRDRDLKGRKRWAWFNLSSAIGAVRWMAMGHRVRLVSDGVWYRQLVKVFHGGQL